jgi:hypothetical protein
VAELASDLVEETFVLAVRAVRVLRPRDADAVPWDRPDDGEAGRRLHGRPP